MRDGEATSAAALQVLHLRNSDLLGGPERLILGAATQGDMRELTAKQQLAVKNEFQRWLMFQVLLAVVLSAVVAAVILYFYASQELVGSFFDAHVKIRRVSDLLIPVVIAGTMVSLGCGVLLAPFLPQKIAGPP